MGKYARIATWALLLLQPLSVFAQFLSWDFRDVATDTRLSGAYPDMAIDATGKIHISYWNQYEDRLIYAFRGPADIAWTREYVDVSKPNGFRSSIALDAFGQPRVAYLENVNMMVQMRYAYRSAGGAWTVEAIPGDPVNGWGEYGPGGSSNNSHRLKHSVDLMMDENDEPQIAFFDGWTPLNAFSPCSAASEYGLRLHQAIRIAPNNWVERGFGKIDDLNFSCGSPGAPLPMGDRYGEYAKLVQRADNTAQVFCLSRFNNHLLSFRNNLPNTDTLWQRSEVDSLARIQPFWTWSKPYFTIEGIDAEVDPDDNVHLAYTTSLFFGENFFAGALFVNDFVYTRIQPDTTIHHSFGVGFYRTYCDVETQGTDSIYITYGNLSALQVLMQSSTDGGLSWVEDTIWNGSAVYTSPLRIVDDSLVVLMFDENVNELLLAHRHIGGGEWRVEIINESEEQGASIDAFVHAGASDTTFTTVFNDALNGKLLFSTATTSSGIQFTTTALDSAGGKVGLVALDRRSNGQSVIAYTAGPDHALKLAYGNPGNWTYLPVDTVHGVQFMDMRITGLDTVHIAFSLSGDSCLWYAKRHLSTGNWVLDSVECASAPVGEYPSLAVDQAGLPHISYYNVSNRSLKYATLDPANHVWLIDSLHGGSSSAIGKYSSIRLDASGRPKIAYLDEQSTALWLTEKGANGLWEKEMVDSAAVTNLGRPIDMEIDSYGKVWIAYNYFSNFDKVKLMHRDSVWQEVAVSSTGQLAHAFAFRVNGGSLNLFGKKNAVQNTGVGFLRAGNGVHVWAQDRIAIGDRLQVHQYPNPFDQSTWIQLEVNVPTELEVNVYDLYGRKVANLLPQQKLGLGRHEVRWECADAAPGVYLYGVEGKGGKLSGKMILMR